MKAKQEKPCFRHTTRLYCNSSMAKELDRCIDYDRFCWNKLWEMEKEYQDTHNGLRKKSDLSLKEYRKIRNSEPWQLELPAYILSQVNNKLKETMKQVIDYNRSIRDSGSKAPFKKVNFKSKKRSNKSFTVPNDRFLKKDFLKKKGKNYCIGICLGEHSKVPQQYRMMEIPELPHGVIQGTSRILSAIIFKKYNEFYISFCLEVILPKWYRKTKSGTIGIDPGIIHTLTLSNGEQISFPKYKLNKLEKKAKFYQSRIDKRYKRGTKKQSRRCIKTIAKFERICKRIYNIRHDWIHKITTKIAKTYKIIKWEDVKPSRMIRTKSFSKYIGEASWGIIKKHLQYKAKRHNGNVILVPCQAASSQICSSCGYVRKGLEKLKSKDHVFVCPNCGYIKDRDINAAKNIANY